MELVHFGKIVATHGVQGAVVLQHVCKKKIDLKNCKALFIEVERDSKNPYFITQHKAINTEEVHINFENINSKEAAKFLMRKKVWLPKDVFDALVDKNAPLALLGFTVVEKGKVIGEIIEVIEQPQQILCNVMYKDQQVFVPLHAQTLVGIDRAKKLIEVSLPDGLLDVYL
jgi:16S rRNA processing protein RimM